jgi:hypothetical protein
VFEEDFKQLLRLRAPLHQQRGGALDDKLQSLEAKLQQQQVYDRTITVCTFSVIVSVLHIALAS